VRKIFDIHMHFPRNWDNPDADPAPLVDNLYERATAAGVTRANLLCGGRFGISHEDSIEQALRHADLFIPTAMIDPETTTPERLAELRDKLREAKDDYWAEQVDIQYQVASAWVLLAQGAHDQALKAMSAAADTEDRTEKAPVTPGPLAPARELYGAMLLEQGLPRQALAAFEATLKKEPHRLNATLGAAKAAQSLGEVEKARAYYAAAVALTPDADPVRDEIAAGRAFMAKLN